MILKNDLTEGHKILKQLACDDSLLLFNLFVQVLSDATRSVDSKQSFRQNIWPKYCILI